MTPRKTNDIDAFSNFDEYVADTNPTNSLSFFKVDAIASTHSVTIFYGSSTGRIYTLEYVGDLLNRNFTNLHGMIDIPDSISTSSFTDTNDVLMRFYRIKVELP